MIFSWGERRQPQSPAATDIEQSLKQMGELDPTLKNQRAKEAMEWLSSWLPVEDDAQQSLSLQVAPIEQLTDRTVQQNAMMLRNRLAAVSPGINPLWMRIECDQRDRYPHIVFSFFVNTPDKLRTVRVRYGQRPGADESGWLAHIKPTDAADASPTFAGHMFDQIIEAKSATQDLRRSLGGLAFDD